MTLKDLLLKILNLVINVDQFKKDLNIKDKEDNVEKAPVLTDPDSEFVVIEADENEEPDDIVMEDPDEELIEEEVEEEKEEDSIINMTKSGLVITDALYVRDGPGKEYNIIGCILKDSSIEIIGQDKNTQWYKIVYKNSYGFVSYKYISTYDVTIENNDIEYGDGCEELDNEIIDNHVCCFKFKTAVITQYMSDTPLGAYGELTEDSSCASHNLPYGTLVYIPKLKGIVNSTGLFTVMDTGGHGMDFDIFTKKDIGKINAEVYVVSYGKGPVAWSYTEAINYYRKRGIAYKYNTAWALYNKMGGCLINFWKYKTDDRDIKNKEWYSASRIKD